MLAGWWAIRIKQNKLPHEWEFLTKGNTLATNKASGLTARNTSSIRKGSALLEGSENNKYDAWFCFFDDFVVSGMSAKAFGIALSTNPNVTTKVGAKQTEEMMSAIRRAVAKYGTVAKVKQAHAKWAKANDYHYVDTSNFKKFAPEGQRSKGNDKPKAKMNARTVTARDIHSDLAYLPKPMRDDIVARLGLK